MSFMNRAVFTTVMAIAVGFITGPLVALAYTNLTVGGTGGSITAIPTLDQVTDEGASTTNNVSFGQVSGTKFIAGLGSAAAPSYTFTGDEDTGMWSNGADNLQLSGVSQVGLNAGGNSLQFLGNEFRPLSGNAIDLGDPTFSFKNIYASGTLSVGGTIYAKSGNAAAYSFSGDEDTYISNNGENQMAFVVGGAGTIGINTASLTFYRRIEPDAKNLRDIGRPDLSWKNIYASGTAYLANVNVVDTTSVTSTVFVGNLTGKRGQICLGDQDGTGFTCLTGDNGTMTAYSTSTY
uniref:Putative structural protein n=1 Tax=viral metagenome TaxID=1070528 RepID=A0A6M3Y0Q6_9ZZZZ